MGEKRKIGKSYLRQVLREHAKWLTSNGEGGDVASLRDADLGGVDLSGANLIGADLSDANLSDANLSDADLSGANLSGAILIGADLVEADLRSANLIRANIASANLIGADLRNANLSGSNLTSANLTSANLTSTNFRDADLRDANLCNSVLTNTQLYEAKIFRTKLNSQTDLKDTNIDDLSGFIFIEDERRQRQERAEQVFDVGEKGSISFSLPENFNPLKVAKALMLVSTLAEGVRLAYTVDEHTPAELKARVGNPELWGAEDDKYAASVEAISKNSPILITLTIIAGVGLFIWRVGDIVVRAYDTKQKAKVAMHANDLHDKQQNKKLALDKWKAQTDFQLKVWELEEKRLERLRNSMPTAKDLDEFRKERNSLLKGMHGALRGEVDQPEVRDELAFDVVSGFQQRWLDLVPEGWPPPEINGKPMPMPQRGRADGYPDATAEGPSDSGNQDDAS